MKNVLKEIINSHMLSKMGFGGKVIPIVVVISLLFYSCSDKKNSPQKFDNDVLNEQKEKRDIVEFSKTIIDSVTMKEIHLIVDEMPKYGNGVSDFSKYILQNMKFLPELDIYHIQFVIDEKGYLLGARVKNKEKCQLTTTEKELLLIIDSMPRWIPARYEGEDVSYLIDMPVRIDVQK